MHSINVYYKHAQNRQTNKYTYKMHKKLTGPSYLMPPTPAPTEGIQKHTYTHTNVHTLMHTHTNTYIHTLQNQRVSRLASPLLQSRTLVASPLTSLQGASPVCPLHPPPPSLAPHTLSLYSFPRNCLSRLSTSLKSSKPSLTPSSRTSPFPLPLPPSLI